jgi:hypothetical protein
MASTLTDPGSLPEGGSNYVTGSAYALPIVKVGDGFDTDNLDTKLSLTGDNTIALSDGTSDTLNQHQSDVPTSSPFRVKPSDIKGLEKKILTELDSQVAEYDTFKKLISDTEGWIFVVQNPASLVPYEQAKPGGVYSPWSGTETKADYTDPDPASTQKIVDSQNALVRALGDTYQLVGEMAAVLNNAAQYYVRADKATFGDGTNVDDFNPPA